MGNAVAIFIFCSSFFHVKNSVLFLEQWRVENCLSSCQRLLAQICDWYCKERSAERLSAFLAISALIMEFADFPLYVLENQEHKSMFYASFFRFVYFLL